VNLLELLRERSTRFWDDEAGTTGITYGLTAAAVGLAVFGALKLLGSTLNAIFSNAGDEVQYAPIQHFTNRLSE
jgi:Flp pilus assembly pilin Flp